MRQYELMLIFNDESSFDEIKNKVLNIFNENKVEIIEEKDFGKRELAYQIGDKKKGHYYLFIIKLEQKLLKDLEKSFKLNKDILRYLVIRQ